MKLKKVEREKKRYLPLLLLGDEQEEMIDRYLERGTLYALFDQDGRTQAVCVVTDEGGGVYEIKNLAVDPAFQRRGIGRAVIEQVAAGLSGRGKVLRVGTGAGTSNELFYKRCGFVYAGCIRDFFTLHYDHPIVEDGVLLRDMAIFERAL